jgi:hypothetical protein
MSQIEKCCSELERRFHTGRTPDDLLMECARKRLMQVYSSENDEFDKLLNKLSVSIDYNSTTDVKKCVRRLLKLTSSNRKILINALRRIY